jgi:hypothetical protein
MGYIHTYKDMWRQTDRQTDMREVGTHILKVSHSLCREGVNNRREREGETEGERGRERERES